MGNLKIVDENGNELDIADVMKQSIQYYEYIDKMGKKIGDACEEEIRQLLNTGKFDEAKKVVRDFFETSRYNGEVIFIEYDLIMANINSLASQTRT
ncbi:MAG: hypothetical protein WAZ12_05175 [Candidatus Absconditicoccaceae bacterium]